MWSMLLFGTAEKKNSETTCTIDCTKDVHSDRCRLTRLIPLYQALRQRCELLEDANYKYKQFLKQLLPKLEHLNTHGDEFCDHLYDKCYELDCAQEVKDMLGGVK